MGKDRCLKYLAKLVTLTFQINLKNVKGSIEHCDMLSLSVVIADRNADKSWSGSESEPDSEDKGAIRLLETC